MIEVRIARSALEGLMYIVDVGYGRDRDQTLAAIKALSDSGLSSGPGLMSLGEKKPRQGVRSAAVKRHHAEGG